MRLLNVGRLKQHVKEGNCDADDAFDMLGDGEERDRRWGGGLQVVTTCNPKKPNYHNTIIVLTDTDNEALSCVTAHR